MARTALLVVSACAVSIALALAAPNPLPGSPAPFSGPCTFSCPPTDAKGRNLVALAGAIPHDSPYSIFECIYPVREPKPAGRTHTCNYYKVTGHQALSSKVDDCVPQALPCAKPGEGPGDPEAQPRFSHLKYEVPSWVEFGRYTLNLRQ